MIAGFARIQAIANFGSASPLSPAIAQLADRPKLALMPVASPISGAELSDFRRKASLFRLLVQLIFPAKEATGQRVERDHR